MKKITMLKATLLISAISLASQSFTIVDSTTDNQLPSMRNEWQNPSIRSEWQDPSVQTCPYGIGEMDVDSNADYKGNLVLQNPADKSEYKDEYSDIEEMESGGNPVSASGWVS